ncbi:interleukin 12 receptor, beta 2a, like isoform X3 [Genypterus blacodes]|uniref:interleukin 12 receptor, beta 2a, like isoform X3 n=1 Tax=Genypterus blacodes TaxID=154954 RepID=UPI003F75ED3D
MATPGTRLFLSILLVNLPTCFAVAGAPARPSSLQCYVENVIHCTWKPGPDTRIPTRYTLYWKDDDNKDGHVTGTRGHASIPRHHYTSHSDLHIWVKAVNQYGTAQSEELLFDGTNNRKPSVPIVKTDDSLESLAISWQTSCQDLFLSEGKCDVRHRTEGQHWPEAEDGFYGSYTLESPEPYTVYEFQVRCACNIGVKSDWSKTHRIQSAEAAPTGVLDVWMDCGIYSTSLKHTCFLTWKILDKSQACGRILGYEVSLTYSDGTAMLVNLTIAEPSSQLVCEETRCHFNSSLSDVSVNVSAYSTHGATLPAGLAMPTAGNSEQGIYLKMNKDHMNVSWDLPAQLLKEYVVQYKQAGSYAAQGFGWLRVNKNTNTAILKGSFENYTAYQVSLFAVLHSSQCNRISSVIGYSLQGIPSIVPSFEVNSIERTHVTLSWQPVPLLEQKGEILCYQVGADSQNVYNVSASPKHEKMTFQLQHLSPGQQYLVWLRAVTLAGFGAKTTKTFKTKEEEGNNSSKMPLVIVTSIVLMVIGIGIGIWYVARENKQLPWFLPCWNDRVPDPRNSNIFKQMTHQFSDSLAWICVPAPESLHKISQLEVVEMLPHALESCLTEQGVGDDSSQTDKQKNHMDHAIRELDRDGTERRLGRQDYNKMIDSDEEQDREEEKGEMEEDSSSLSEEEQLMSGYEKHFMPTALEVLEV